MKLTLYVCIILLLVVTGGCDEGKREDRPNVILIMVDDMGIEALPSYGNIATSTPNIDKMVENGIRFTTCISQPLCTPSRVKIMTGQYNYRNYEYFGYLNTNQYTFGNLFQDQGYATCIAGKWQLNGLAYQDEISDWNNPARPNELGFDEYCLWQLTKERKEGERFANPLIQKNGDVLPRDPDAYGPGIFSEFIIDFIEREKDNPFFIYYPMVLVHDPFVPTPDSPEWQDESKRYDHDTTYFTDMVEYTDKIVGRINTKLKELDLEDDTIVLFTADNGTHPSVVSNTIHGPIQGGKGNTTDAGTLVPLVVSWGSQIENSMDYDGVVEFSDFYSTFVDILEIDRMSDGVSFLPVLRGENEGDVRKTAHVHYDPKWGANVNKHRDQFVRTRRYKLYKDGMFYDLQKDRLESSPLPIDSLSTAEQSAYELLQQELVRHPVWSSKGY